MVGQPYYDSPTNMAALQTQDLRGGEIAGTGARPIDSERDSILAFDFASPILNFYSLQPSKFFSDYRL